MSQPDWNGTGGVPSDHGPLPIRPIRDIRRPIPSSESDPDGISIQSSQALVAELRELGQEARGLLQRAAETFARLEELLSRRVTSNALHSSNGKEFLEPSERLDTETRAPICLPRQPAQMIFQREGEYWTLGYQGQVVHVRHCKGLPLILHLLSHPGERFHVVELAMIGKSGAIYGSSSPLLGSDLGPKLDASAKASYKRRLGELREELEEARRFNDEGRVARLEAQIDFIWHELVRSVGLSGRDRRDGVASERVRYRVRFVIRSALTRISLQHQALGACLSSSIKTGTFCWYNPDPRSPENSHR